MLKRNEDDYVEADMIEKLGRPREKICWGIRLFW